MGMIMSYFIFSLGVIGLVIGISYYKKNPERKLNKIFLFGSLSSAIWNFGFGLLFAQTDVTKAWMFRCIGEIGVFGLMSSGIILTNEMAQLPNKKIKYITNAIGLSGFALFPFVNDKAAQTYTLTKYGMAYSFDSNIWFTLYNIYNIVFVITILTLLIIMYKKSELKRKKVFAQRFIMYIIIMFIGTIFDTIMPLFGFISFPGSTLGQGIGLFIGYNALVFNDKNSVSAENIDNYIFHSSSFPILVFDYYKKLSMWSDSAFNFLDGKTNLSINEIFESNEDILDRKENNQSIEYKCLLNNKTCQLSVEREYDKYGDIISYVVAVFDVTEKNKMLEEIEKERLNAENASKAKETFLANISHEIRTPLNAMLGTNEIMSREDDIQKIREYNKNISDAGANLLTIIDDILNYTKIETGNLEIIKKEFNPTESINSVLTILENKAKEKNLTVSKMIDTLPYTIMGDKNRIEQILINLIDNAIKFTNAGGVLLKASSEIIDEKNINFVLQVSDSGIGIEQAKINDIFTSFKELEDNMYRTTSGVGLGLAIVKKLVGLMKGTISVGSIPNQGTTFLIKIPCEIVLREKPIEGTNINTNSILNAQRTLKIINVDDNKMNLSVFKGLLKRDNVEVDLAQNGMEGIEKIKNNDYDIIFLDHMMPEMDGIETLNHIREYEKTINKRTPIVVLTANATEGSKEEYIEFGFDDYISKPTNRNQIIDTINKFIK